MAKKKAKAKQTTEDIIRLIHPDIGFDEPEEVEAGSKAADTPDYAAQLAAMQAQFGQMQEQLAILHRTNLALMAAPPQTAAAPQVKEFSMDGLPDPHINPTAYAEQLNKRVQETIRSQQEYANYKQTQEQSSKGIEAVLWEKFQERYAAYADDEKKVKYVAEQVLANIQRQGLDVGKYVTGAQDVFMADVVKEYDATFGKPTDPDEDDDDEDDAGDDSRTGGMFGGVTSGGRPTSGSETEDDMFTQLRNRKIKEGWY